MVDKLLTGFDAPTCTVLYIDKSIQDTGSSGNLPHNRLDGEDKHGSIVDYKDLFERSKTQLRVLRADLDYSAGGVDPEVVLQDRLTDQGAP